MYKIGHLFSSITFSSYTADNRDKSGYHDRKTKVKTLKLSEKERKIFFNLINVNIV